MQKLKITLTNVIGTLFNLVQGILNVTLLHQALVKRNQEGNSNRSVKTISFNSRFDSSPSPLKVLKLILSADKFFVNLKKTDKLAKFTVTSIEIYLDRCFNS